MAANKTTKTKSSQQAAPESQEPSTDIVYDFDNWSPEAEDAALAVLNDVRYIIVEGDFVGRFADGSIVRIPLGITMQTVEELQEKHTNTIDQFKSLLTTFAGEDVAAELASRNLVSMGIMTEKYFRALKRAQELAFPES